MKLQMIHGLGFITILILSFYNNRLTIILWRDQFYFIQDMQFWFLFQNISEYENNSFPTAMDS